MRLDGRIVEHNSALLESCHRAEVTVELPRYLQFSRQGHGGREHRCGLRTWRNLSGLVSANQRPAQCQSWPIKGQGWGGGPFDISLFTSPNWTFGFGTSLGLGLGLGGLDLGLGLDNKSGFCNRGLIKKHENYEFSWFLTNPLVKYSKVI